jgi:hypothetical protein
LVLNATSPDDEIKCECARNYPQFASLELYYIYCMSTTSSSTPCSSPSSTTRSIGHNNGILIQPLYPIINEYLLPPLTSSVERREVWDEGKQLASPIWNGTQ